MPDVVRCFPMGMLALFLLTPLAFGDARREVRNANQAFADGNLEAALQGYRSASVDLPESDEIRFNIATVLYHQGLYSNAVPDFQKLAASARDLTLAARSHFNLGNCAFRESERQRDADLQKSLAHCEASISHYQDALQLDPALSNAAENIEIARLTLKNILDAIKKQQEQQQQQQQAQQQAQEQLQQLIEQQQQQRDASQSLARQQSTQNDPESTRNEASDQARKQQDLKQQAEAISQQLQDPQNGLPEQARQQQADKLQQAAEAQQAASDALERNAPAEAVPQQDEAIRKLKEASDDLQQQQSGQPPPGGDQGDQSPPQQAAEDAPPQPDQETPTDGAQPQPQPEATDQPPLDDQAHDILAEEQRNKEDHPRTGSTGYRPVDKDW